MDSIVLKKEYTLPTINEQEVLRYMGSKGVLESELYRFLQGCINECNGRFKFEVCYKVFPLRLVGDECDFGVFKVYSKDLKVNLKGCDGCLVLAATVGVEIDRLITKYSKISPLKSVIFQAIGAERIERLCDEFCKDFEASRKIKLKPRFSPGYGDLPLSVQRELLSVLECNKKIGVTLNDSLLMSPTKSVTAFVGIKSGDVL